MADPENIGRYLQNQLNPSDDVAIASVFARVKERAVGEYAGALRGEYAAEGSKRDAKIAEFSKEFDNTIIERMQKGINNKNADPDAYKEEDSEKKGWISKGVSMGMSLLTSVLGGAGAFIDMILQLFGVNSHIEKWVSGLMSNLTPEQKAKEQTVAGMVSGIEGKITVGGKKILLTPEEKKEMFEHLRDADLDTPITAPVPRHVKVAAAEVPNTTAEGRPQGEEIPKEDSGQLPKQTEQRGTLVGPGGVVLH